MKTLRPLVALLIGGLLCGATILTIGCGRKSHMMGLYGPISTGRSARPRRGAKGLSARRPRKVGRWETIGSCDELWIIERSGQPAPGMGNDAPGQGELRALVGAKKIPLPLKHTDVKARVSAFLATVKVKQQYQNPYEEKIEAVYVFPLPQNAAVTDFVMVVGDRRIRGIIRERQEAKRIYEDAKKRGYVASLLTQERPNIFTQRIANIEPGKRIDVEITYFSPLRYEGGEYEFVFPMLVGPRFNPPGYKGGIGAVGRGRRGASGQAVEVEYLKTGKERSGHDVAVSVEIDAGVRIEKVYSNTHVVNVKRKSPTQASVSLAAGDRIPNRDLVLRYRVAGKTLKTAFMTGGEGKEKTFALVLQPPAGIEELPRMPREMVFVLDCSGSMSGKPLDKAKEAMRRCLRSLDANDTFQIIRFSNRASALGRKPIPATPRNLRKGLKYLASLRSCGGTMMIEGIKAALDFPHDEERLRIVSFMTDGYIGNESQILAAIKEKRGASRIFSFGVGGSVNRYLLERMAKLGRGAAAFVNLKDSASPAVDEFYRRAARPALADIRIDWGDLKVSNVYPQRIPDLFVGRPVMIVGQFKGEGKHAVRISGRAGGKKLSYALNVNLDASGTRHAGVAKMWARWKIKDLHNQEVSCPSDELRQAITSTSLRHGLLCRYTAFLAVDSTRQTKGDHGVTVKVPVPTPEGVKYETTVNE
jgi:Ca-activated chloride channel homolog